MIMHKYFSVLTSLAALIVFCLLAAPAWGQSVTRPTFVALQDVQKMMEEERYEDALVRLEALSERLPKLGDALGR